MLIYQMTHKPTGKIYIGSLKDDRRWEKYNTSSKVVSKMMKANPEQWARQILCIIEQDSQWDFKRVVQLEERLIRRAWERLGWDGIWNKCIGGQSHRYNPNCEQKRREAIKKTMNSPEKKLECSLRAMGRKSVVPSGKEHCQFKGVIVGTNIETGEKVYFNGKKELQSAGFHQGSISHCVLKNRKSHKGFTWEQIYI